MSSVRLEWTAGNYGGSRVGLIDLPDQRLWSTGGAECGCLW
jgi:hypothetical protein